MYLPYDVISVYGDLIVRTSIHHMIAGDKGGITDIITKIFHFYANDPMSGAGSR